VRVLGIIDLDQLHRLIVYIAAYRERHHHTGDDPLGHPPDTAGGHADWQHLHHQLIASPAATNPVTPAR